MAKPRIFIVEDEEEARSKLKAYLMRNLECEISEAGDGRQALERIEKEKFDLILLDIKMQGISGLDVLERVKAISPETEVIVISAYDSAQVAKEALQKGACDYIPKSSASRELILKKAVEIFQQKNKYLPKKLP